MSDLSEILQDPEIQGKFKLLKPDEQIAWAWRAKWLSKAHRHQVIPPGDWWTIWLMLAGETSRTSMVWVCFSSNIR